jgi:hypothetical protein
MQISGRSFGRLQYRPIHRSECSFGAESGGGARADGENPLYFFKFRRPPRAGIGGLMLLSEDQKSAFRADGFVLIPGVIPRPQIDAALRAINHSVGQGMNVADMREFAVQSYCPELRLAPVIVDLLEKTGAMAIAESAIGAGKVRHGRGQIALRFPKIESGPIKLHPHLDGMYSPTNGVAPGVIDNFTALMGILLSDLPEPDCGNFTVWPGSHLLYADYFKSHSPQALLNGMPKIPLPQPRQITGKAGDVVLVHYLLGHAVGPHFGANIRYLVFFRLKHADHEQRRWDSMTDPWLEWEGMRPPG